MAVKKKKSPQERIDAFGEAIEKACRKYGVSISHEDREGGFIIEPFNEDLMNWFKAADVQRMFTSTEPEPPSPRSVPTDNRNWKEKLNIKETA